MTVKSVSYNEKDQMEKLYKKVKFFGIQKMKIVKFSASERGEKL